MFDRDDDDDDERAVLAFNDNNLWQLDRSSSAAR